MNSRAKGAAGEREFAAKLRDHGFTAHRGQQFKGTPDSPDVVCDELAAYHFEVKRCQRLNVPAAYHKAHLDAGPYTPVLAHRANRSAWLVTMSLEDWLAIVRESKPNPTCASTSRPTDSPA